MQSRLENGNVYFIFADWPGLGGPFSARERVWLFLKTFLSLIVFWTDTCLLVLALLSRVNLV